MRARSCGDQGGEPGGGRWADADEAAALDVDDQIAMRDRARAVRNDKARAPGDQPIERLDDGRLVGIGPAAAAGFPASGLIATGG